MTIHSSDTRQSANDADDHSQQSPSRAERAAATVARINENGGLSLLLGGTLLVGAVRSVRRAGNRRRTIVQGIAGTALLAVGLRHRRSEPGAASDETSDEAAAHREASTVLNQDETNPRGTSGEPDVEREADAGTVDFTDEQDLESGRQPGMADEPGTEDPRSSGDEAEIDLSEASMADESSEATGPSSTQSQPAQTDDVEPERSAEDDIDVDVGDDSDDAGSESDAATDGETEGGAPDPDADPGEATEEAADAEPAHAAEDAIEEEIDDPDREGVETEGGTTVHTDTNESDAVDVDVEDVTDGDDEGSGESGSHLDDERSDESAADEGEESKESEENKESEESEESKESKK
jgi:hypothetical protein